MTRFDRAGLGLAAILALAACAAPAAPAPAPDSRLGTATLALVPPAARYDLQDAARVHRWVPGDILRYRVVLAARVGEEKYDLAHGVKVYVPVKGGEPKSMAIFTGIPQGKAYRAFVTAEGNVHGVVADPFDHSEFLTLNSVPGTADFDFTAENDVEPELHRTVQVVFDATPFSGTAGISFEQPPEGKYVNPDGPVAGAAH